MWCFLGDGETDEPESLGSISLAAREGLDNLTWVINCNLQRLDGPVRGNGKIIQELEAIFRGAGWNVIKVIWGSGWDDLLTRDVDGVLLHKMNTTVDGEFQRYAVESGAYIREHFFGPDPRLRKLVEHLSDDDLRNLPRGGHDYEKMYAAYKAATEQVGAPTVILAKTVKGWTLGSDVEARNATHQIKKMTRDQLKVLRLRLRLDDVIPEDALDARRPALLPAADGLARVPLPHGAAPGPRRAAAVARAPPSAVIWSCRPTSRSPSSTPAPAARPCRRPWRSPACCATWPAPRGSAPAWCRSSPTRPARSAWTRCSASSASTPSQGQHYESVDAKLLLSYTESQDGQLLEEGITEAGSMSSFTAAGTSYATHGVPMVPFFIFYSMFGFQRVGDLIWAAADAQAKGFLLGATAGRTTLMGEGLQHQDGHSLVLASTVPTCQAYDPAFAYETATIIRHGLHRMYGDTDEAGRTGAGDPSSTTSPSTTRTTRCRRGPSTCQRGRHRRRALPVGRGPRGSRPEGHHRLLRLGPPRRPGRPRRAGRAARHRRRAVVGHLLQAAARGRALDRALEPPAPDRDRRAPSRSPSCSADRAGRSSPSPTS